MFHSEVILLVDVMADGATLLFSICEYLRVLAIDIFPNQPSLPTLFAGVWAIPQTVASAKELKKLMKKPIAASEASHKIGGLFGTDDLFDAVAGIEEKEGKDADVRPAILRYLKEELEFYDTSPDDYAQPFEKEAWEICNSIVYTKNKKNDPTRRLKRIKWEKADPKIIAALLEEGADPNETDRETWTSLHYAARFCPNSDVTTILIKAGAQVEAKDDGEATPLHFAARNNPNLDVTTILLKAGAQLDAESRSGATTLHYAAGFNPNLDVITFLLKAGLDPKAKDGGGVTILHYAAGFNPNPDVTTTLLKAGAQTQLEARDDYGRTPLHFAAGGFNPNPDIITILLEAGAQVDVKDRLGKTPLHCAAEKHLSLDAITILLKAGAQIEVKNIRGQTPLYYAEKRIYNFELKKKNPEAFIALLNEQNMNLFTESKTKVLSFIKDTTWFGWAEISLNVVIGLTLIFMIILFYGVDDYKTWSEKLLVISIKLSVGFFFLLVIKYVLLRVVDVFILVFKGAIKIVKYIVSIVKNIMGKIK